MNRITNKPFVEEKDSEGRPDADLAAEAWANYRARNDSLVVDHFQVGGWCRRVLLGWLAGPWRVGL